MTAVLDSRASQAPGWRANGVSLVICIALLMWIYRDTALGIVSVWERSATFTHGYAVLPISLWLIWCKREELLAQAPSISPRWAVAILAAGLLWLAGELAMVNAATHLGFAAMLVFAVPALIGGTAVRTILFPLAFVFFAVPIGEFMMPAMISWTADFTVWALRLSGIPVFREGEQLVIPSGHWAVVEACSGIRYLMSSLMVGALFAYLNYRSTRRRVLFMLFAFATPIVANWVRAYLIVLTGHLSGNQVAVGVDHLVYGWVFFGIVVMIMFAVGMRWAEFTSEPRPGISSASAFPAGAAASPWKVAVVALAIGLPMAVLRSLDAGISSVRPVLPVEMPATAGWRSVEPPFGSWVPAFQGAADHRRWAATGADDVPVGLYVGYWRQQATDGKLVSSSNVLAGSDDAQWRRTQSGSLTAEGLGRSVQFQAASWRGSTFADGSGAPRMRTAQVYWINGVLTERAWQAKVLGSWFHLLGRGDDAAVLVWYTPVQDGEDADARLANAIAAQLPGVMAMLQKVRDAD